MTCHNRGPRLDQERGERGGPASGSGPSGRHHMTATKTPSSSGQYRPRATSSAPSPRCRTASTGQARSRARRPRVRRGLGHARAPLLRRDAPCSRRASVLRLRSATLDHEEHASITVGRPGAQVVISALSARVSAVAFRRVVDDGRAEASGRRGTLRRIEEWADEWQAVAASRMAERSRAEVAVASLYRDAGGPTRVRVGAVAGLGLLACSFASCSATRS